jgi:signal transduction histidine kinase
VIKVRQFDLTWVLAAICALGAFVFSYGPGVDKMDLGGSLAIAVASGLAVWLSGRRPIAALVFLVALVALLPAIDANFEAFDLVVVVVLFQLAAHSLLSPWTIAGIGFGVLTAHDIWQRLSLDRPFLQPSVSYPLILTAMSVGFGTQIRNVRRQNAELLALRQADRERAVAEERRRIARDLHDVAAHHLSALVVRNKLATRLATPEALAQASEFTAKTAGEALDALRGVVRVLNTDDEQSSRAPQPSLGDLDALFERMAEAGLDVEREVASGVELRRDVEVAVVRIAQEALANVLRHRGAGRCWFALRQQHRSVDLVIEDDGQPGGVQAADPASHTAGSGFGLVGMRERAEACGGSLNVGRSPRGGWMVVATLPAVGE